MLTRKHPTYTKHLSIIMFSGIIMSLALFLNVYFFEGKNILASNIGLYLAGVVTFSTVIFGFWFGNHVKCPICSNVCEIYSDEEEEKSRKVICKKCHIIWVLGVSYNVDPS